MGRDRGRGFKGYGVGWEGIGVRGGKASGTGWEGYEVGVWRG